MRDETRIIPRKEPEVIAAEARKRWNGDDEKVPTTSFDEITVCGVTILSRYKKASEFEVMREMIIALPEVVADKMESIWCNSKEGRRYTVYLKEWDDDDAAVVGEMLHRAAMASMDGGHGGIRIEGNYTESYVEIDAEWMESA